MKKLILILLIAVGSFFQLATVFRSGQECWFGICFWGPNGHDGVWHLSLIRQAEKGLPLANPVFGNQVLKNYHWGYNFLAGFLVKILPFSPARIHFQILPLIFSISLGILSFKLGVLIGKSFWIGFWFSLLNYFAGSLGWLVTLFRNGALAGESVFWSMQSISFLLNPPFAFSVLLFFLGFYLFKKWEKKLSLSRLAVLALIFGSLLNVKAYSAILFFLSLGGVFLWNWLRKKKKDVQVFSLGLASFLISFLIWFFWLRGGGFPFIFQPLWFVRTLFEAQDRLFLPKLAQVWWVLKDNWFFSPRFWLLAFSGMALFLIGNFGSRIFGLFSLKEKTERIERIFLLIVFFGILMPLLFLQKGTAWNTIQFLYYSLIFSNWFLARFIASAMKKKKYWPVFLILPLLPANLGTLKDYFGDPAPAAVPGYEVEALAFLEKEPEGMVLTFPYDDHKKRGLETPIPLYLYQTTAYVAAFSGKNTFLEDEMNLEITGYDWKARRIESEKFFSTTEGFWARGFLLNNQIDYLYLVNDQKFALEAGDLGIEMIFDNGQVKIYKVLK